MNNPIATLQRTAAEYRQMDKKDKRRYVTDQILNNALYILMIIFVIYTAIQRPNFMTLGSFANLITQVAAYLPMALGIGEGSEIWQPMGISVVGGLVVSTLLTLFIVPSLYAMLEGRKERKEARKAQLQVHEDEFIRTHINNK